MLIREPKTLNNISTNTIAAARLRMGAPVAARIAGDLCPS
jgi:hypothetical protein